MNLRDPAVEIAYVKWTAMYTGDCTFCDTVTNLDDVQSAVQVRHDYFIVMKNRFPYRDWDNMMVTEHLMIVPKRHISSLNELSDVEAVEFVKLMAEYEHGHYSIYTRSHSNKNRTIAHVHTHLFKGNPL